MKDLFKKFIVTLLTYEATILLKRHKPKIIAITGSVGKTSIKDALFEVFKGKMHVRKSEKSFNSEFGVPLTILGLPTAWSNPFLWLKNVFDGVGLILHNEKYPELLILEMGVDRPYDMDKLTSWITPHVVILTRLPDIPVHVEYFDSPEAVAEEKLKLARALKQDGILVFNHDDERLTAFAESIYQTSIGYARYSKTTFMSEGDSIVYENGIAVGCSFTISHLDESVCVTVRGSLGIPHTYNYSAVSAVASIFNISLKEVASSLTSYIPPQGRMRLIRGIKDTLIIDDTYNSSPTASERSLETLKEIKGVKRRIAVLGDMMELGQFSIREHERIGRLVPEKAGLLVTIGVRAKGFSKGAREAGMDERKIIECDDAVSAGKVLQTLIKAGDVILIKGSQSIRAERCVEEIMAEPERVGELLVRQDPAWKKKV